MTGSDACKPPLYHGTRADLRPGDLIAPGHNSNYGARRQAGWVYLTGTFDAAIWGAELAQGDGRERIYIVEPTGEILDDPNHRQEVPRQSDPILPLARAAAGGGRGDGLGGPSARAAEGDEGTSRTIEDAWGGGDRLTA